MTCPMTLLTNPSFKQVGMGSAGQAPRKGWINILFSSYGIRPKHWIKLLKSKYIIHLTG